MGYFMANKELGELFSAQESEKRELFKRLREEGVISSPDRANKAETNMAYGYVLDTAEDAAGALAYVSKEKDKPDDWVSKVRHSSIYKNVLDYVIEKNKTHPVATAMEDSGILNRNTKRSLRTASSLNSLLNTLSSHVQLTRRVEDMEGMIQVLASAVIEGSNKQAETDQRLDVLESIGVVSSKEKALLMLSDGVTVAEVARRVGKNRKTITRWRDEL